MPTAPGKTFAQLKAMGGLPNVSSGNVNRDSISPYLGLKYKGNIPAPPSHVVDPIDQKTFDDQYTDFTYPFQNIEPLKDVIDNCEPIKDPSKPEGWQCKDWDKANGHREFAHDKYREYAFPSEFKYLSSFHYVFLVH